jgi:hypothetical protein
MEKRNGLRHEALADPRRSLSWLVDSGRSLQSPGQQCERKRNLKESGRTSGPLHGMKRGWPRRNFFQEAESMAPPGQETGRVSASRGNWSVKLTKADCIQYICLRIGFSAMPTVPAEQSHENASIRNRAGL